MNDFVRAVVEEVNQFTSAANRREHVIVRCEKLFDEYVKPVDLPGPDAVIDPIFRIAIRPLVGQIYDEILKRIKA